MPTVRFVSLTGKKDVAPPFRTPSATVTDELVAHVEAHTGRAVRLCDGEEVLRCGDALPEDGVMVVAPTSHRTLAHAETLDPRDCVVKVNMVADRHGRPLTWEIRNLRVTFVTKNVVVCMLTNLQKKHLHLLWKKSTLASNMEESVIDAYFYCFTPSPVEVAVGDVVVDVVFHVGVEDCTYFRIVSICKV
jgi:hypothetical protein